MAYRREYEESDAVRQARELAQQQAAKKPGEYNSQWKPQMEQTAQQIANRGGFKYDLGTDPLYNQYRQQYMRQGKMAMADTVGQAAAMNGGFGSSYGQTAGQQVYNQHIQQLNDRIPELYGMALQKWQAEGADLMDRFGVLGQMEGQDYSRYRDQLRDWEAERNHADSRYDAERDFDRQQYDSDRNFGYQAEQDQLKHDEYYRDWAQKMVEDYVSKGETPPEWLVATSQYDTTYLEWLRKNAEEKLNKGKGGVAAPKDDKDDAVSLPAMPTGLADFANHYANANSSQGDPIGNAIAAGNLAQALIERGAGRNEINSMLNDMVQRNLLTDEQAESIWRSQRW